uniref:AbrB/MazE/SpoVT family DNA-binding domain-containing protein n=1 Tax=candidate division CPR3 bacterium TaxID=2268181 RepID=A0A7C4M0P3_UNCC3
MSNKIIKVGSSAAVTIPKKVLKDLSIDIGDKVFLNVDAKNRRVVVEPVANFKIQQEITEKLEDFIKKYKRDLEKLSE